MHSEDRDRSGNRISRNVLTIIKKGGQFRNAIFRYSEKDLLKNIISIIEYKYEKIALGVLSLAARI